MKNNDNNTINANDLFLLITKQNEIISRIKNGKLSIKDILINTQDMLDGKINDFPQSTKILQPLTEQAKTLRTLNRKMPKHQQIPDSWFYNLNIDSDHIQRIENLETFFVVPTGSLKDVVEYQVRLTELTRCNVLRSANFDNAIDSVCLDDTAYKKMFAKPGIHLIHLNLVYDWNIKKKFGNSADDTRKHASENGVSLAGLAAVGAYALQSPELLRSMNAEKIPDFDIAEIRLLHHNESYAISMSRYANGVIFNIERSRDISLYRSRPCLVKEK